MYSFVYLRILNKSVRESKAVGEMLKTFAKEKCCDFHTTGENSASKCHDRIFVEVAIFFVIS
jgi:hypothetical protein